MTVLLELRSLQRNFGGVQAVRDASFAVEEGSITGLIGPNGAGKTTTLSIIAGEFAPDAGQVIFSGSQIGGLSPHAIARRGIYRTFQLARELGRLTVMENVLFAHYPHPGEKLIWALLRPKSVIETERALESRARDLLRRFGLYDIRNQPAATLSGGQKKLLDLARAVMADARLVLMDEPTAGVNPALRDRLLEHIAGAHRDGLTVLLVEHNLSVVDQLCDDVVVMSAGTVLRRGRMTDLRKDQAVISAYLGGETSNVDA